MLDFEWHAVKIIWNEEDVDVFKTLLAPLPFKIKWNDYAEGTCLCQYEEDTLCFWRKKRVDSCSGACARQRGAYVVLNDDQLEVFHEESHRNFATFKQVLEREGYRVLRVKAFLKPNGTRETFTSDLVYDRVEIPLQGKNLGNRLLSKLVLILFIGKQPPPYEDDLEPEKKHCYFLPVASWDTWRRWIQKGVGSPEAARTQEGFFN